MKRTIFAILLLGLIGIGLYLTFHSKDTPESDGPNTSWQKRNKLKNRGSNKPKFDPSVELTSQVEQENQTSDDNLPRRRPSKIPKVHVYERPADANEHGIKVAEAGKVNEVNSPATSANSEEVKLFPASAVGVTQSIKESINGITECYAAWQNAERSMVIEGRVTMSFTIDIDPDDTSKGKVTKSEILGSELNHMMVEGCILSVMSNLLFEAPKEKMVITYPFDFSEW